MNTAALEAIKNARDILGRIDTGRPVILPKGGVPLAINYLDDAIAALEGDQWLAFAEAIVDAAEIIISPKSIPREDLEAIREAVLAMDYLDSSEETGEGSKAAATRITATALAMAIQSAIGIVGPIRNPQAVVEAARRIKAP